MEGQDNDEDELKQRLWNYIQMFSGTNDVITLGDGTELSLDSGEYAHCDQPGERNGYYESIEVTCSRDDFFKRTGLAFGGKDYGAMPDGRYLYGYVHVTDIIEYMLLHGVPDNLNVYC